MYEFHIADPNIFLSWTPEFMTWLAEGLARRKKEEERAIKKAKAKARARRRR